MTTRRTLTRSNSFSATSKRTFRRLVLWHDSIDSKLIGQLCKYPETMLAMGTGVSEKARGQVVKYRADDVEYLFKHQVWGDPLRRWRKAFSISAARREWNFGRRLLEAGVTTPRPLAVVEERLGPACMGSYFLAEIVNGDSLYRVLRFANPSRSMVDSLAKQFAWMWQQLDLMSISHGDLKTENLVVDLAGELWLIDLEKARYHPRAESLRLRQTRDLGDLLHPRNWRSNPLAAEQFRQALLQTPAAEMLLRSSDDPCHPLRNPIARENKPDELVTVLIIAYNATPTLATCVESVREMADEVIIADLGSSDGTQQLARQLGGCRLVELSERSIVKAMEELRHRATFPWVMHLFANERLNSALSRQIQDRLARGGDELGFRIPRTTNLHRQNGREPIRLPSTIRLYRRNRGNYEWHGGQLVMDLPEARLGNLTSKLVVELQPHFVAETQSGVTETSSGFTPELGKAA